MIMNRPEKSGRFFILPVVIFMDGNLYYQSYYFSYYIEGYSEEHFRVANKTGTEYTKYDGKVCSEIE